MKVNINGRKTSDFGAIDAIRGNKPHTGVDYSFAEGTKLEAVGDGVIERIADFGADNAGKTLYLRLDDGTTAIYGHLSEFKAEVGQRVSEGQIVALSGNTGVSTGPHLHFGLKAPSGEFIDPSQYEPMIASMGANTGWLTQKYNDFADYVIGKEAEFILEPIGRGLERVIVGSIDAIYGVLPEIGALITVIGGAMIMLTGNPSKWLARWALGIGLIIVWKITGGA